MEKEYWFCFVGPMEDMKIPYGADIPLRESVADKYKKIFGKYPETFSSGWGLSERKKFLIGLLILQDEEILETMIEAVKTFEK